MEIQRSNGEVEYNPKKLPITRIVFVLTMWSESRIYLWYLADELNNFPDLKLYVYDIDSCYYEIFKTHYNTMSHGKGETYWLFNRKIINTIEDYRKEKLNCKIFCLNLEKLMNNL